MRSWSLAIDQVDQYQRDLLGALPYTDSERAEVIRLCDEERQAIRDWYNGSGKNLTGIRNGIAKERVEISRRARKRMAPKDELD